MRISSAGICRKSKTESGFTLIELVVAMAIVMIIAGAAAAALGKFGQGRQFDGDLKRLVRELRYAALLAQSTGSEVRVYFDPETNSYVTLQRNPGQDVAVQVRSVEYSKDLEIRLSSEPAENSDPGWEEAPDAPVESDPAWNGFGAFVVYKSTGASPVRIELEDTHNPGVIRTVAVGDDGRVEEVP